MTRTLKALWTDEQGQGITEYALLLVLVSLGLIVVMGEFRDELGSVFNEMSEELGDVTPIEQADTD
jgi:pilus assembly protein Flp/PilA